MRTEDTIRDVIAKEVFHGIPEDERLKSLPFSDLAVELSGCEKDSPKFLVLEREIKKRFANDQASINRPNMLWAAGVGGVFALIGVFLGAYLKHATSVEEAPPSITVRQIERAHITPEIPMEKVAPNTRSAIQPANHQTAISNNGQPPNTKP